MQIVFEYFKGGIKFLFIEFLILLHLYRLITLSTISENEVHWNKFSTQF